MCKYCFSQKKADLAVVEKGETAKALRDFIDGKRTIETNWCDWDIPLHWGGMSDPFQPAEREHKLSLECLKVFKETQYPFVVSTKGKLIAEGEYLDLIKACNCVVQISLVCPEYEQIEPGAPSFDERLEMISKISPHKRVNVRIQPYMTEVHDSIMQSLHRIAEAGAYGVVVEGMKFAKKKAGLEKVGGDWCYPADALEGRFAEIKAEAHRLGMKFYSGENRLRSMGDALCCCGIDGLEGFKGNAFNINHILNGQLEEPTESQQRKGTAHVFNSIHQAAGVSQRLKALSLKDMMLSEYINRPDYYNHILRNDHPKE